MRRPPPPRPVSAHAPFASSALDVFLVLAALASEPVRWSQRDFGDAQSTLLLRQWTAGGRLDNYLRLVPQELQMVRGLLG